MRCVILLVVMTLIFGTSAYFREVKSRDVVYLRYLDENNCIPIVAPQGSKGRGFHYECRDGDVVFPRIVLFKEY